MKSFEFRGELVIDIEASLARLNAFVGNYVAASISIELTGDQERDVAAVERIVDAAVEALGNRLTKCIPGAV